MDALLITGTDSGVGKTVLTMALAAYWQRHCGSRQLGILKPIECGIPSDDVTAGDRALYHRLFDWQQSIHEINPLAFAAPLVPAIAAQREGRRVELERVWQQLEALSQQRDFVLIEGWGSLGSPLTRETTMADLAWDWRLPVVLVVPIHPGTIAQAVAYAALADRSRVHLKGIILNCVQPCHTQEREDWADVSLIQSLTNKPVLGWIPHLADPTDLGKLAQVASNLTVEKLMPLC